MRKIGVALKQVGAGAGGSKAAPSDAHGSAGESAPTASSVIMLDDLSLDSLVAALRARMPANTSITISN